MKAAQRAKEKMSRHSCYTLNHGEFGMSGTWDPDQVGERQPWYFMQFLYEEIERARQAGKAVQDKDLVPYAKAGASTREGFKAFWADFRKEMDSALCSVCNGGGHTAMFGCQTLHNVQSNQKVWKEWLTGGLSRSKHLVTILEGNCTPRWAWFQRVFKPVDAEDFYGRQCNYFQCKWPTVGNEVKEGRRDAQVKELIADQLREKMVEPLGAIEKIKLELEAALEEIKKVRE